MSETDESAPAPDPTTQAAQAPAPSADPHQRLIATPLRALVRREPITLPPQATIRDAATLMRDQRVSSVLLVEQGRLRGIVTDRDLRNRVIAEGISTDRPIAEIATMSPMTVELRSTAFEAMLVMARHNVHHVPVMEGARLAGMITATDVAEHHRSSAVFLAGEIYKQDTLDGLKSISARIRHLQRDFAAADATAYSTGQVVTAITDALTTRLIQMAEAELGPPPVPYAWVAAGSQARSEQTAKSDQDNCLFLSDDFDPVQHGAYFEAFSRSVCSGLDACGYIFCPGEMMAMTDTWRQPQRRWRHYFERWIDTPEPKALMLTCVFFDLRLVHGEASLLDEVRADVLARTPKNGIFLAHMVRNALSRQPPLNLFGRIAPARSGEHRGTVDLKMFGIVPIIDLARVYALAGGHAQVNTHARLEVAARSHEVTEESARNLRDALEFLAALRIQHQARQIDAGHAADNFLALDELSTFERTQLKDAFHVVHELQDVLGRRYEAGRF